MTCRKSCLPGIVKIYPFADWTGEDRSMRRVEQSFDDDVDAQQAEELIQMQMQKRSR